MLLLATTIEGIKFNGESHEAVYVIHTVVNLSSYVLHRNYVGAE